MNANTIFQNKTFVESLTWDKHSHIYYTDGVQKAAMQFNLFWFVWRIAGKQEEEPFCHHPFQVWLLQRLNEKAFILKCFDAAEKPLHFQLVQDIETELDTIILWYDEGCILLPSEY